MRTVVGARLEALVRFFDGRAITLAGAEGRVLSSWTERNKLDWLVAARTDNDGEAPEGRFVGSM